MSIARNAQEPQISLHLLVFFSKTLVKSFSKQSLCIMYSFLMHWSDSKVGLIKNTELHGINISLSYAVLPKCGAVSQLLSSPAPFWYEDDLACKTLVVSDITERHLFVSKDHQQVNNQNCRNALPSHNLQNWLCNTDLYIYIHDRRAWRKYGRDMRPTQEYALI